jgi:hypothetical protein
MDLIEPLCRGEGRRGRGAALPRPGGFSGGQRRGRTHRPALVIVASSPDCSAFPSLSDVTILWLFFTYTAAYSSIQHTAHSTHQHSSQQHSSTAHSTQHTAHNSKAAQQHSTQHTAAQHTAHSTQHTAAQQHSSTAQHTAPTYICTYRHTAHSTQHTAHSKQHTAAPISVHVGQSLSRALHTAHSKQHTVNSTQ